MNWYKQTSRYPNGSKEGYFDCPECGSPLTFDDVDSAIYGVGRHLCQVCLKVVLPLELRKVPIDQRISYLRQKAGF